MLICNFAIPFPILAIRKLRTITGCVVASLSVLLGMWLERFLIIVPSLSSKHLPYSWGEYRPQPVEITLMLSTFFAMALLFVLFSKFVPMISIWELKVGGHQPHAATAAEQEEAQGLWRTQP